MAKLRSLMAVAAGLVAGVSADWTIIAPKVATIATGIDFTSAQVGYLPADVNGVGTEILKTQDGGKTWAPAQSEPFALLLLDIAAYANNVAVIGALSFEFSWDGGATFNSSLAPLGAGQCIRNIGGQNPSGFGAVGQFGLFTEDNGVAISTDAGLSFTGVNISDMVASARYGAFPTASTWFVAAGDWPGEGSDSSATTSSTTSTTTTPAMGRYVPTSKGASGNKLFRARGDKVNPAHYMQEVPAGSKLAKTQSSRLHLLERPDGSRQWATVKSEFRNEANLADGLGNSTTWDAQIAMSTDAGKTWTVPFSKLDSQYYMNGIECSTPSQCCAVAETGDTSDPQGGTYIWCTSDGGATFTETLVDNDPESSLTDISFLSDTEFVAVGGEFTWYGIQNPSFYSTTDGGKSWTKTNGTNMDNQLAIAVDCEPSANNCWANLLDILTQESSIAVLNA